MTSLRSLQHGELTGPGMVTARGADRHVHDGPTPVTKGADRARTRALRLLARERYAEYAEIYEQVRLAAPDRYQARNRARKQLRNRHPDRYLELHAQEHACSGTDVPAVIRSKFWQPAGRPTCPGLPRPVR